MSVQFGRWNFDGQPVDPEYVGKVDALLAPYGPDGHSSHSGPGITVLYHAFHTSKESRREKQPHISTSGAVITWDGRLDNRSELIRELADALTTNSTDLEIAAAAYEEWGEKSFAKLLGDWALSLWNSATCSLILAKDVIGTRHLYYAVEESGISWSTILDPLVLLAGRRFQLCEEYIAGWLGFFPATHLTPYIGIDSVPPSSFVRLQPGKREIQKYWDFDPHERIRYRTDVEYEEHFRIAFGEAVRRRLRSDSPVLAELSGGVDSSSIVCMADEIIARGRAETPRVDTISYYDDSEPNWNERPFFSQVEEKRGRAGCHINLAGEDQFNPELRTGSFHPTPYSGEARNMLTEQFANLVAIPQTRVLLSGIGGDEMTGGVPTPIPELMDLIAGMRFTVLVHQLKAWALDKRQPWRVPLLEALCGFLSPAAGRVLHRSRPPEWLLPGFLERHWFALSGYRTRATLLGPAPSFRESLSSLEVLRRQLENSPLSVNPVHEKRYPYLDRGLLQFIFSIPREQVVRPGQRRSLMRRALTGAVPAEILNRRRKAFVSRAPMAMLARCWEVLSAATEHMIAESLGIVDSRKFRETLQRGRQGDQVRTVAVIRTLRIEFWLKELLGTESGSPCVAPASISAKDTGGRSVLERNCAQLQGTRCSHMAERPSLFSDCVQAPARASRVPAFTFEQSGRERG